MSLIQLALIPVLLLLLVVWLIVRRRERAQEQAWEQGEEAPAGGGLLWNPLRWLANRRARKDAAQPRPAKQRKSEARQQPAATATQALSPAPVSAAHPVPPASQTAPPTAPVPPDTLELQQRYLALTQRIEAMEQEARRRAASPPPVSEAPRPSPVEERGIPLGQIAEERVPSLRAQAQAALDYAASIREETLRFRNEARQSLDKALNLIAAAHQAGSIATEELEQARAQAREALETARRQALQEADDIRQQAHVESQRLLNEAAKIRGLVERELEEAHSLAAEARARRDAAHREFEQARAMKQAVETLRLEVLRLMGQQSEVAAPPPAPRAATPPLPPAPSMEERTVETPKAQPRPPARPQAEERREPGPAQPAAAAGQSRPSEPASSRSDIEQALAELLRGAGSAHEPEPPTPKKPAKDNPPQPPTRASVQGPDRPHGTTLEARPSGIGRAVATPPQEQPAAAAQQPVAGRPAPSAEPKPLPAALTGAVTIVAMPAPAQDTLGRLWTAIESVTGIGSIVGTRSSKDPAGLELAVDLGGQTVETAKLSSALYGADIQGAGDGRIVVRLPGTW